MTEAISTILQAAGSFSRELQTGAGRMKDNIIEKAKEILQRKRCMNSSRVT
jgi:hypothetical protein